MADDEVIKVCLNPDCTGKNPMKGNWCTAKECKDMRKLAMAAKKADKQAKACAAVGVPACVRGAPGAVARAGAAAVTPIVPTH